MGIGNVHFRFIIDIVYPNATTIEPAPPRRMLTGAERLRETWFHFPSSPKALIQSHLWKGETCDSGAAERKKTHHARLRIKTFFFSFRRPPRLRARQNKNQLFLFFGIFPFRTHHTRHIIFPPNSRGRNAFNINGGGDLIRWDRTAHNDRRDVEETHGQAGEWKLWTWKSPCFSPRLNSHFTVKMFMLVFCAFCSTYE